MQRIAKEGVFVVPQMWGISPDLAKNPSMPAAKVPEVKALGQQYKDFGRNLLKHKVKVVFASDYVGKFADGEPRPSVANLKYLTTDLDGG